MAGYRQLTVARRGQARSREGSPTPARPKLTRRSIEQANHCFSISDGVSRSTSGRCPLPLVCLLYRTSGTETSRRRCCPALHASRIEQQILTDHKARASNERLQRQPLRHQSLLVKEKILRKYDHSSSHAEHKKGSERQRLGELRTGSSQGQRLITC